MEQNLQRLRAQFPGLSEGAWQAITQLLRQGKCQTTREVETELGRAGLVYRLYRSPELRLTREGAKFLC